MTLSKLSVIKIINSLLSKRIVLSIKSTSLEEELYDMMLQKYGLRKVAEIKFNKFLEAIKYWKSKFKRALIVARFLNIDNNKNIYP